MLSEIDFGYEKLLTIIYCCISWGVDASSIDYIEKFPQLKAFMLRARIFSNIMEITTPGICLQSKKSLSFITTMAQRVTF